jgi:hypothetical protein
MPWRYLLDEQLRGVLWDAVLSYNAGAGQYPLDIVRVGGPPDLPLGTLDPAILLWAEREGRIVVSHDLRTMPVHFADHLRAGSHSPGLLLVRGRRSVQQVILALVLTAYAEDPAALVDSIRYIP